MVRPNTEGYELERDEIGFYDWEQRPADEVLGEMRAKGLDISSYQEMVENGLKVLCLLMKSINKLPLVL